MKSRKAAPRPSVRQTSGQEAVPMVTVQNVNVPGYTSRVNAAKYTAMRRALLGILPARPPGLSQAEMFRAVKGRLPERLFPGGATSNWWAKTVQLDLEKKGFVRRSADSKPLRWYCVKADE
jgi:hypothetical protein